MSQLNSWFEFPPETDFSIQNIPFGIFSQKGGPCKLGTALGNHVLNLEAAAALGIFESLSINPAVFSQDSLNKFIALGKSKTNRVRKIIQKHLVDKNSILKSNPRLFLKQHEVAMHLPVFIGNYTDFYSSKEHATNVGKMFRDPENALLPNWLHLPVAYHGRSSSIVISGTTIQRPKGQILPKGKQNPVFKPSTQLDFELEMGFIIGKNTKLGQSIPVQKAEDYIFGMVLFNDWSARDIQKWEYVPLGPFLSKSFASAISPWVVTLEALAPFKTIGPPQEKPVLPYLKRFDTPNYDINLEVYLKPQKGASNLISKSNFKHMYWNMSQQLAHQTINGCNICIGDIMASGTISGKNKSEYGSMLELAWAGTEPLKIGPHMKRSFIEDFDTVIIKGFARQNSLRVGFGQVENMIKPSK